MVTTGLTTALLFAIICDRPTNQVRSWELKTALTSDNEIIKASWTQTQPMMKARCVLPLSSVKLPVNSHCSGFSRLWSSQFFECGIELSTRKQKLQWPV